MSKKRTIQEPQTSYHVEEKDTQEAADSIKGEPVPSKARRIDTDITDTTMFASITNSDDEGDSSFEMVDEQQKPEEPYMSQLRTPPHQNSETVADDSLANLINNSESQMNNDVNPVSQNISFGDQDNEDNEEESGGGSSAASTAADIMREMLEEFPRSNDTLVINSREESDEDGIDQDFEYNEKFEMMLQDDASPSLPHGFDVATASHQDSDQTECNDWENQISHTNDKTRDESSGKDDNSVQSSRIKTKSANLPSTLTVDLPPLPIDKEKRPPSPPSVDPQYNIKPQFVAQHTNANEESRTLDNKKDGQCKSKLENSAFEMGAAKQLDETANDVNVEQKNELSIMDHEEGEESEDEWSENEDIAHDLLDADLSEKAVPVQNVKDKKKEPHEKIRSFLVDRGKNHFTVLPEGWIQVRHYSGMPVYLHKQTRVVTLSKPYVLGPNSVKSHHIPLGSITCLNYRKAKEEEETLRTKMEAEAETISSSKDTDPSINEGCGNKNGNEKHTKDKGAIGGSFGCPFNSKEPNESATSTLSAKFPLARITSLGETKKAKSLSPDEFKKYCANLFEFREVKMKSFPNWKQKRLYNKEVNAKRLKAQVKKSMESAQTSQKEGKKLEKASLPDFKLITIPILEMQKNDVNGDNSAINQKITKKSKKEWIFNPKNKTPVCILHEYLQHSIRQPPEYKYSEIDSAKTPYSAVVLIRDIEYGKGVGTSKKQAKSEAARVTLEILMPDFKKEIGPEIQGGSSTLNELPDVSFFDSLRVEDPRVSDLCMRIGEPSPYAVLITCLQKNYGLGDTNIESNLKPRKNKKNEFTMKVNNREVSVICKNKKDGKQLASQKLLQLLHPQIQSWGSLLRLYGSTAIQAQKLKKERESEVTVLQSRHSSHHPSPSQAILEKLKEEMRKLSARKKDALPIGKLTCPGTFPGANYGAIGVAEKINL